MKKSNTLLLLAVSLCFIAKAQFVANLNGTKFWQSAQQTPACPPVFISDVSFHRTDALYLNGILAASFTVEPGLRIAGVLPNDTTIAVFTATMPGPDSGVFSLYRARDLTLLRKVPLGLQVPLGRSTDFHDIAYDGNRFAIVYNYDSVITHYGDTVGQFMTRLQEVAIYDATTGLNTRTIALADVFPYYTWNKRGAMTGIKDPTHTNSLQFFGDTLYISMRNLGIAALTLDEQIKIQWHVPTDSLGTWPILQHSLRRVGNGIYSIYSNGDMTHFPQGIVFRVDEDGIAAVHQTDPAPFRSIAQGSYWYNIDDTVEIINYGVVAFLPGDTVNVPRGIATARKGADTIFDLSVKGAPQYSSYFLSSDIKWGTTIRSVLHKDTITFVAIHPETPQKAIWYFVDTSAHELYMGDTLRLALRDAPDSIFFSVESADQSGGLFRSAVVRATVADTTVVVAVKEALKEADFVQLFPNPTSATTVTILPKDAEVKIYDIIGRHMLTSQSGSVDISRLIPGTYCVKVQKNNAYQLKRLTIR